MKRRIKLMAGAFLAVVFLSLPFNSMAQQGRGGDCQGQGQGQSLGQKQRQGQGFNRDDRRGGGDRLQRLERDIPDLTSEQKESIKTIHLATVKDITPMKNELGEKQAKFRTLQSQENPDMKAIDKQIEDIAAIKAKIAKREAKTHQDIRALLTEDQRAVFDMKSGRRMEKARFRAQN